MYIYKEMVNIGRFTREFRLVICTYSLISAVKPLYPSLSLVDLQDIAPFPHFIPRKAGLMGFSSSLRTSH